MKRSEVLVLTPFFSPNIGGVETHLDDLCAYLRDEEVNTHVLTFKPITAKKPVPYQKQEHRGSVTIYRKWWPGGDLFHRLAAYPALQFAYITSGLLTYALWFMVTRGSRIATIHAHGLNAAFIGRLIGLFWPVTLVGSTHALYGFDKGSTMAGVIRWVYAKYQTIHALSLPSERELIAMGVPADKVTVTYYWVDAKRFSVEKNPAPGNEGLRFIFVGRLLKIKGAHIIIELARQLTQHRFVIIGTGEMETAVAKAAEELPNLTFEGYVANDKLPAYLAASDALIIPSQYDEGLGRVIIEALYCGLPVIGTNRGGIPEAVAPEVGILTDGTVEGFLAAIRSLEAGYNSFQKAAAPYARAKFGLANAEKTVNSYSL